MKYYLSITLSISFLFFASLAKGFNDQYYFKADISVKEKMAKGEAVIVCNTAYIRDSIPFIFARDTNTSVIGVTNAFVNGEPVTIQPFVRDGLSGFWLITKKILDNKKSIQIRFSFISTQFTETDYLASNSRWLPFIPHIDEMGVNYKQSAFKDINFDISFPKGYKIATTGVVVNKSEQGDKELIQTKVKDVIHYGIALSDKFIVSETEANGLKIYSYYFEDDVKWGKKLLEMAKDVVLFYQKEIGFYPCEQLTILPGEPTPMGGYPFSSNVFVIHRGLDDRGEDFANWIIAHEIGHYYWGFGYILSDARYISWFGLGMGIYTDWLYSKQKGLSKDLHDDFEYRYMAGSLNGYNTTIHRPASDVNQLLFDVNNVISHGKAFVVLKSLDYIIGKEKFMIIFKNILKVYKGKVITTKQFQSECEKVTGVDLQWFFQQWLNTSDVLDYRVNLVRNTISGDRKFKTSVQILKKGGVAMPIEIEFKSSQGQKELVKLPAIWNDTVLNIETKWQVVSIQIDPEKKLPLMMHHENNPKTILTSANFVLNEKSPGLADFSKAIGMMNRIQSTHENNLEFLRYYGFLMRRTGNMEKAISVFQHGANIKSKDKGVELCLLQLARTYDLMNQREKAVEIYKKLMESSTRKDIQRSCSIHLKTPYEG